MNNTTKLLIAISAGAVVGGTLGILLAPAKGTDTRRRIAQEGKKITRNMKTTRDKVLATVNDIKDEVEKVVKEKVEAFV
jgi:gas vesicle protein